MAKTTLTVDEFKAKIENPGPSGSVMIFDCILPKEIANYKVPKEVTKDGNPKELLELSFINCDMVALPDMMSSGLISFQLAVCHGITEFPKLPDSVESVTVRRCLGLKTFNKLPPKIEEVNLIDLNVERIPNLPDSVIDCEFKTLPNLLPEYKAIVDRIQALDNSNLFMNDPAKFKVDFKVIKEDLKKLNTINPKEKFDAIREIDKLGSSSATLPNLPDGARSLIAKNISGKDGLIAQQRLGLRDEIREGKVKGGKRKTRRRKISKKRRYTRRR